MSSGTYLSQFLRVVLPTLLFEEYLDIIYIIKKTQTIINKSKII